MKNLKKKYEIVKNLDGNIVTTHQGFSVILPYIYDFEFDEKTKKEQMIKLEVLEKLMQVYSKFAHAYRHNQTHVSYIKGVFLRIILEHTKNAQYINSEGITFNEKEALVFSRFKRDVELNLQIKPIFGDGRIKKLYDECFEISEKIINMIKKLLLQKGDKNMFDNLNRLVRENFDVSSSYDYSLGINNISLNYDSRSLAYESEEPLLNNNLCYLKTKNNIYKVETKTYEREIEDGFIEIDGFQYQITKKIFKNHIKILKNDTENAPSYMYKVDSNTPCLVFDYVLPKNVAEKLKGVEFNYVENDLFYHIIQTQEVSIPEEQIIYVASWNWDRVLY